GQHIVAVRIDDNSATTRNSHHPRVLSLAWSSCDSIMADAVAVPIYFAEIRTFRHGHYSSLVVVGIRWFIGRSEQHLWVFVRSPMQTSRRIAGFPPASLMLGL